MKLPIVMLILVLIHCSVLTPPVWSESSVADTQQGTAEGSGMDAASAAATILYFPFKAAFALGGGIVGSLAYVFSGFNETTAKSIWIPSMYGTYVITPEHLTGEHPVRFLGIASEGEVGANPSRQ